MAAITITIPDALLVELASVLRGELGADAEGRPDRALLALYLRRQLQGPLMAKRRREQVAAAVAAEYAAREAAVQAVATENAARLFAEAQADASAQTDIGGIV